MTVTRRISKRRVQSLLFSRRIPPEATTMTTLNNSPAPVTVTKTKRAKPIASSTVVKSAARARTMVEIASVTSPKTSNAVQIALAKPSVIGRRPRRSLRKPGGRGITILTVAIGTTRKRMTTRGRRRIARKAAAMTRARTEGCRTRLVVRQTVPFLARRPIFRGVPSASGLEASATAKIFLSLVSKATTLVVPSPPRFWPLTSSET
mmetsp:Transcript_5383/g.15245  ORF Transcript_5383/g.15245 Transcript_5383/m.15245 type:complete len:206 (+) Transcript_5383:502-1119(+)